MARPAATRPTRRVRAKAGRKRVAGATKNWSGKVTRNSNALDLSPSVFTWKDPERIARSLMRSAMHSKRRKSGPLRSAMSMLTFYINRAGRNLPASRRRVLERAKEALRTLSAAD